MSNRDAGSGIGSKEKHSIYQVEPKKPNFSLVLILSGAFMLLFFAAVFLFFSDTGKKALTHMYRRPNLTTSLSIRLNSHNT